MTTLERVTKILIELGHESTGATITPNDRFADDLMMDSLDQVEAIMEIEKQFGITIPDESASTFTTVQDIVNFIDQQP